MTVFKAYIKLAIKNRRSLLIFVIIFMVMATILTSKFRVQSSEYKEMNYQVGIIDHDRSELSQQLINHFVRSNKTVITYNNPEELRDATFKGIVNIGFILQKNDLKNAVAGKKELNAIVEPGGKIGSLALIDVNRYLLYMQTSIKDGKSPSYADKIIQKSSKVEIIANKENLNVFYISLFRFASYLVLSISIAAGSTIMTDFTPENSRRINISSMSQGKLSAYTGLGQAVVLAVLIMAPLGLNLLFAPSGIGARSLVQLVTNVFVLAIFGLALSFFINALTENRKIIQIILNTIPLGVSFISGVFIEPEVLGKTAVQISKFFPVYYYVKGIGQIVNQGIYPFKNNIYMILFTLLMILMGVAVKRRKLEAAN